MSQKAIDTKALTAVGSLDGGASRRRTFRHGVILLALATATLFWMTSSHGAGAAAPVLSQLTVSASDLETGLPLSQFTFTINVDNSPQTDNPDPTQRPGYAPIPSNSPVVAEGDQNHRTVTLPNSAPHERYLISIRSPDHKLWGDWVALTGNQSIDIKLRKTPLPLGKLVLHVFGDTNWTNGAPDTGEGGLAGFHVTLDDQIDGQVVVDYYNQPLCGGDCVTDANGDITIPNLSPATYFIYVTPPDGTDWVQTTTIDGGFALLASTIEGDDGLGAPGETIWEGPNATTGWWFGFQHSSQAWPAANAGTATITGVARNWVGWPPFDTLTMGEHVANPYVALSDASSDTTVWVGQGDSDGNFMIENVPAGTYNMSIWDEQLSYIMRFVSVTVADGQVVDMGDVGVSRWFGWLSGYVYQDTGIAYDGTNLDPNPATPENEAAGNSLRDCADPNDWTTCETGIENFPMDQRWRDGSMKEDAVTTAFGDPHGPGYYEYPTAEGGPLGKFIIGESGFTRFGTEPGPSVHSETPPYDVNVVGTAFGGGLLTNQLLAEGHHAWVDWGKRPYAAGEPGQIVGITYNATTRNEFDGYKATNEKYEPAIPDVQVNLESTDGTVLNVYSTDHWHHPSLATDGQQCSALDANGNPLTQLNPALGPNCLETPLTGIQTKDGAFDGGYAFADYCPKGYDASAPDVENLPCWSANHIDHEATQSLVPGMYVVHAIMPKDPNDPRPCNPDNPNGFKNVSGPMGSAGGTGCLYHSEREEDVNVDLGAQYVPAIPPPPCYGDLHTIDQSTLTTRSPYSTSSPQFNGHTEMPLCDKKLIELKAKQNANADFFLMTNFKNGVDVEAAGRVMGHVFDDIVFDRDPQSIWYGEPRPIANIPVGIYDYNFRLLTTITTDDNGAYEAMLPSTETFNCPIPQGPCPGMYIVIVDDPGSQAHPNKNYDPDYLTANTAFDIWPGQTTQLDTPIDPISGTGCELPSGMPELLQVNRTSGPATPSAAATGYQTADGPFVRPSPVNDTWRISHGSVTPTGGTYRITVGSNQTGPLAFNANAATVRAALAGLPSVGAGNVEVTGGPLSGSTALTIAFTGALAGSQQTVAVASSLTPTTVTLAAARTATGSGPTAPAGYMDNTPALRRITIQGVNFGTVPASLRLSDFFDRTGSSRLYTGIATAANLANVNVGGIVSWSDRAIVFQVPAPHAASTSPSLQPFYPGQYQMWVRNAGGSTPQGITLHVLGTVGSNSYNPRVRSAAAPGSLTGANKDHELQIAIDNAVAGDLVLLSAGVYHENVLMGKPIKLQGIGVGGTVGATEAGGPPSEDPRFNIQGSSINGRFFRDTRDYWVAKLATIPYDGQHQYVSEGADITVLATDGAYKAGQDSARIDGMALELGQGSFGAGGIEVHAFARNLQITNNVVAGDKGQIGGGINLGTPYHGSQHNENVAIKWDRVIGSGGVTRGGGVTIFNGADNYEVANSILCSNFSMEYGAGLSHWGNSPGGWIHDNKIYYNDAVDSGGGISIQQEVPQPAGPLGEGSGTVDVRRNLIEANWSGDDGGGIFLSDAHEKRINLDGNMIVNNGAADVGGGVMFDDSLKVAFVNNTVAQNASTSSSETGNGLPHSGGIASGKNSQLFQNALPRGAAKFSDPVALFNNIFWNNEACTLDRTTMPPSLVGCNAEVGGGNIIDFEVQGTTGTFSNARYNLFTNANVLQPDGNFLQLPAGPQPDVGWPTNPATNGNLVGVDPQFVAPFGTQFAIGPSRLDPQRASVTITHQDPPVGIEGDYHLITTLAINQISGAVDRGVRCSNTPVPPPAPTAANPTGPPCVAAVQAPSQDIDQEARPQPRTLRIRTLWDLGADEVPTLG